MASCKELWTACHPTGARRVLLQLQPVLPFGRISCGLIPFTTFCKRRSGDTIFEAGMDPTTPTAWVCEQGAGVRCLALCVGLKFTSAIPHGVHLRLGTLWRFLFFLLREQHLLSLKKPRKTLLSVHFSLKFSYLMSPLCLMSRFSAQSFKKGEGAPKKKKHQRCAGHASRLHERQRERGARRAAQRVRARR